MATLRVRRIFRLVHQYTGFIFAGYLIVVCASGSALILLENQIAGYRDYAMLRVPVRERKVALSDMVAAVQRANPGKQVYHILASCPSGCTYDLSMHSGADRLDALVDPYTGAILRTIDWDATPVGVLYRLHGSLFSGDAGETVNAIAGLSLVVLAATGLYLWPWRRGLQKGFVINWRGTTYRVCYDLHKATGIIAVAFLAMWALTAAGQIFWPEPPEAIAAARSTGTVRTLGALVRIGDSALPGEITFVSLLSHGTIVVRKRVPGDPDPYGYSYIAVEAHTGKVIQAYDFRAFPPLWRFRAALYAIHIGAPGGLALRLVYAIAGLAPAVLFTTAFLMWLKTLKRAPRAGNE